MGKKAPPPEAISPRRYRGEDVPPRVIRSYARAVAERFRPDKIILFGSHAYGAPHADSDVDLLVVMPARDQHDQSVRIRWALPAPFPMDLLVRTPQNIRRRLGEGDSFLRDVLSRGKILYEKPDEGVGTEGRGRPPRRRAKQPKPHAPV